MKSLCLIALESNANLPDYAAREDGWEGSRASRSKVYNLVTRRLDGLPVELSLA